VNAFTLSRADVGVLLSHSALYGLAAILDDAGIPGLRIWWSRGIQPRAHLHAPDLDPDRIGRTVLAHATTHAEPSSWVMSDVEIKKIEQGREKTYSPALMSPRLTTLKDDAGTWDQLQAKWQRLQAARHDALQSLTDAHALLDLRLLAALGEPCYWSHDRKGELRQDDGAARLEMQPRNRGSEFVGNRLRKLAEAVAARDIDTVVAGLAGTGVRDEVAIAKNDSRFLTATGLASPGPTDNALAWCALWGISQFPIAARTNPGGVSARRGIVVASGHLGRSRQEWFYVPVWARPWPTARLRSIIASRQLANAASAGLPQRWAAPDADIAVANAWLHRRGVDGVVRFPIHRFGSDSAPERRAMQGEPLPLAAP